MLITITIALFTIIGEQTFAPRLFLFVRGFCCLLKTLLMIYIQGGPYYSHLHNVLGAYVCYRPDLGYVQV